MIRLPPNASPDYAPSQCLAQCLDAVISHAECDALVARARPGLAYAKEFRHTVDGQSILVPILNPRRYRLAVLHDQEFADRLWQRLRRRALDAIGPWARARGHGEPLGLCGRLRVLCYAGDGEDRFEPHYDRIVPEDDGLSRSLVTVLVYLNDGGRGGDDEGGGDGRGGGEFSGGETIFLNAVTPSEDAVPVTPRAGRVVLFEHALYHTGAPLHASSRGSKFVMRTDVMFATTPERKKVGGSDDVAAMALDPAGAPEDVEASVAVVLRRVVGLGADVIGLLDDAALIMSLGAFRLPGRTCMREMVGDCLGEGREVDAALVVEAAFGPDGSAKVEYAMPDAHAAEAPPDEALEGVTVDMCSIFDNLSTSSESEGDEGGAEICAGKAEKRCSPKPKLSHES